MRPNEDKPTAWFEPLYQNATIDGNGVPWAHMETHPLFQRWLNQNILAGSDKKALVIGCGLGDDAIHLESLGFEVTAFDVSFSAIEICKKRFPDTEVKFVQNDLFDAPREWSQHFDFVLEIYTIQALPPKYEAEVIKIITGFVKPGGTLLAIAAVTPQPRHFNEGPPWKLTEGHVHHISNQGFSIQDHMVVHRPDRPDKAYITSFIKKETNKKPGEMC